jgi:hypothetical protein
MNVKKRAISRVSPLDFVSRCVFARKCTPSQIFCMRNILGLGFWARRRERMEWNGMEYLDQWFSRGRERVWPDQWDWRRYVERNCELPKGVEKATGRRYVRQFPD